MPDAAEERDARIADIVDAYVEAKRVGNPPAIGEICLQHPDLADDLMDLLPMAAAAESLAGDPFADVPQDGPVLDVPDKLGQFRLLSPIGKGGMGAVYEAEDEDLQRKVAVKILLSDGGPNAGERFQREARIVAKLEHDHIVPIYAFGEQDGLLYLAMRLVQGVSWASVCSAGRNVRGDPVELVRWRLGERDDAPTACSSADWYRAWARNAVIAADALGSAHAQGIWHRDVTPGNLMLDSKGKVWVTDFGLAKGEEDVRLTSTHSVVGTLRYLAPEQLDEGGDVRSDIYGLGLCLLEAVTQQIAFPASSQAALIKKIVNDGPPRASDLDPMIPAPLAHIIDKATQRDPDKRYPGTKGLIIDLQNFLSGKQPIGRPGKEAWEMAETQPTGIPKQAVSTARKVRNAGAQQPAAGQGSKLLLPVLIGAVILLAAILLFRPSDLPPEDEVPPAVQPGAAAVEPGQPVVDERTWQAPPPATVGHRSGQPSTDDVVTGQDLPPRHHSPRQTGQPPSDGEGEVAGESLFQPPPLRGPDDDRSERQPPPEHQRPPEHRRPPMHPPHHQPGSGGEGRPQHPPGGRPPPGRLPPRE